MTSCTCSLKSQWFSYLMMEVQIMNVNIVSLGMILCLMCHIYFMCLHNFKMGDKVSFGKMEDPKIVKLC